MEQAQPPKKPVVQYLKQPVRRQVQFDPRKQTTTNTATVIQRKRIKGICYKCKEPWFPCRKNICKLANQVQIQTLQDAYPEDAELVYYTKTFNETEAPPPTEPEDPPLQIPCMLSWE